MSFQLTIVVRSNPINFQCAFFLHEQPAHVIMRIDKVNWIIAHNYGKPKTHSFKPSLSWNGKFWTSTLSHKMCPRKQTTEPKCWSWYHFSQEKIHVHVCTSSTDISYCIHIMGSVPFHFYLVTLYNKHCRLQTEWHVWVCSLKPDVWDVEAGAQRLAAPSWSLFLFP